jgi:hypothetical protein
VRVRRPPLLLAAVLLASLAAGIVFYQPIDFGASDCVHVDVDGVVRSCEDAGDRPASPTAATLAANWDWWGPAAAPVTLGLLALAVWLRARRFNGANRASPAPRRP